MLLQLVAANPNNTGAVTFLGAQSMRAVTAYAKSLKAHQIHVPGERSGFLKLAPKLCLVPFRRSSTPEKFLKLTIVVRKQPRVRKGPPAGLRTRIVAR